MPAASADETRLRPIADALQERFPAAVLESSVNRDGLTVKVRREDLRMVLAYLKSEQGFNALQDIIALDLLKTAGEKGARFLLLYQLYQFPGGLRVRVAVEAAEGQEIDSAEPVYKSADWAEREAYDMFGIRFAGHPGLKRIYLPEDFEGFPLRKDFPVEGTKRGF
jgi:NADH-quinone oxidoreductase subunit C